MEATAQETGGITGTKDKDYNIIWFVEQCLQNALRLETYIQARRLLPQGPAREPEGR